MKAGWGTANIQDLPTDSLKRHNLFPPQLIFTQFRISIRNYRRHLIRHAAISRSILLSAPGPRTCLCIVLLVDMVFRPALKMLLAKRQQGHSKDLAKTLLQLKLSNDSGGGEGSKGRIGRKGRKGKDKHENGDNAENCKTLKLAKRNQ